MSEAAKEQESPKKSGGKLILFAVLGLVLAAGGAGGAWFALSRGQEPAEPAAEAKVAKKKPAKKPLFTTLDPFTVNLRDPRGERFAQIGITLQFEEQDVESTIKDRLPAVRNDILMLISSKQIEELLTVEGKQLLAEEIQWRAGRAIGVELPARGTPPGKNDPENPIRGVLFSQFIVQ
jgi:flagellar FliL protein